MTLSEKIYGLSLIWMEASYNFPYWDRLQDIDWDRKYEACLSEICSSKDLSEYFKILLRFINTLNDGHTTLTLPEDLEYSQIRLPFDLKFIEGKYYIIN
jgi:carboxyl-terminal processing protease